MYTTILIVTYEIGCYIFMYPFCFLLLVSNNDLVSCFAGPGYQWEREGVHDPTNRGPIHYSPVCVFVDRMTPSACVCILNNKPYLCLHEKVVKSHVYTTMFIDMNLPYLKNTLPNYPT